MGFSFRFGSIGLVWAALGLCSMTWAQPAPVAKPGRAMRQFGTPPFAMPLEYVYLLTVPTVQVELKLTEEQQARVKEGIDNVWTPLREMPEQARNVGPEDIQAKMEKVRNIVQAKAQEMKKAIKGVLLPTQLERLKEIALQAVGAMAIIDKEVQQDLELSDDQVARIKAVYEDLSMKAGELLDEGGDPQAMRQKRQQHKADFEKQLMDVLTPDQKATLEKMKGAKFTLPVYDVTATPRAEARGKP
jgi:hypothetical protein